MSMTVAAWTFWLMFLLTVYVYLGYPLLVFVSSRLRPRPIRRMRQEPSVSILIAAHNEEAHIGRTLENKLSLDYPADKLQILVVSDGSTDATDAIARQYADRGVALLRQEPRNGKTAALNFGVRHALGELLVFADANSLYDLAALRHLVSNFSDPSVGYVTGKLAYVSPDGSMTGDGCTMYMRYENFIRRCESRSGSLVGVNGGIDMVRRGLYEPMSPDDLPDLVLPLRVVARGYRVVYEPLAVLSEFAHGNARDEYRMRVRVALRAFWTIADMPALLDVRRYGLYSLQLLSHKVLRYVALLFVGAMLTAAAVLWPVHAVYRIVLVAAAAFLGCAGAGFIAELRGRQYRWLAAPYYFMLVNLAALQALVKFLKGERHRMWTPRLG